MRTYPFAKGLSAMPGGGRGGWRPRDTWGKALGPDTGGSGAGHWTAPPAASRATGGDWAERLTENDARARDAEALSDPSVSQALRTRVVAAALSPASAFAAELKDEIVEMCDDGRLSVDIAAALLRAINPKNGQAGGYEVGDTRGGDAPLGSLPVDWGATLMGGGGPAKPSPPAAGRPGPAPVGPLYAPASDNPGYLFDTSWREGKKMRGLAKRPKLTRLQRKCQLINEGPFNEAPDMRAIEKQVAREFELGLIAA
jgi:hypothetical protein